MIALPLVIAAGRPPRDAAAARRCALAAGRTRRGAAGADDDVLALGEVAAQDLGRRAVADAQRELDGLELVALHDEHAAGRAALGVAPAGAATAARRFVVARLLLGREDLADAQPRGLADPLAALLALVFGSLPQSLHLLPAVLQDRIELLLLLLRELEARDEPLADLLERGPAAAPASLTATLAGAVRAAGRAAAPPADPAAGAPSVPAGRKRSAAFGILRTLAFSATIILAFAVMPGSR